MMQAIIEEQRAAQEFGNTIRAQEFANSEEEQKQRTKLERLAPHNIQAAEQLERIKQLPESMPYLVVPPPSNIWAQMRSSLPMRNSNGDVAKILSVPAEIMFNEQHSIRIICKDTGAQKVWRDLFDDETGLVPINDWGKDCYYTIQYYGQWFPLEYWEGKDFKGIAALEPMSVWVGYHQGLGYPPMSIVSPQAFDEAKWRSMTKDAVFTTSVTDQNIQTFPAFRIPLPPDVLTPVYAYGKIANERYAAWDLPRAYNSMMFRMMLREYRQGVLESWMAQLLILAVEGWNNSPPSKGSITAIQQMLDTAISTHKGDMVVGYKLTPHMIKPDPLDKIAGIEAMAQASGQIYTDLGFDIFFVNGAIAGEHGRGGGVQVEVSAQIVLERWKSLIVGYFNWCRHWARKWAEKNDRSLLDKLPSFKIRPSNVETFAIIEKMVVPLVTRGILSTTTALDRASESYEAELANKMDEEPHKEKFLPPPSFAQMTVNPDGTPGDTAYQSEPGRPKKIGQNTEGAIIIQAQDKRHDDLKAIIAALFATVISAPSRATINAFAADLERTLRAQMGAVYSDGYHRQGGLDEPDLTLLNGAITFQAEHLRGFKSDMLAALGEPEKLGAMQHRASLYAGALVTAFVLGSQAGAKSIGSSHWQRVLHPELSQSGPCEQCLADSAIVHPIDDPFVEYHPNECCSMQSIRFHFAGETKAVPLTVMIPPVAVPGKKIRRAPFGGVG
jgi:hypothetical protein